METFSALLAICVGNSLVLRDAIAPIMTTQYTTFPSSWDSAPNRNGIKKASIFTYIQVDF